MCAVQYQHKILMHLHCFFIVVVVEVAVVVMMVVVAVVWMQKNVNIQSCSFPNVRNMKNIKFPQI